MSLTRLWPRTLHRDEVLARAYELYLIRLRTLQEGSALSDWLQAINDLS